MNTLIYPLPLFRQILQTVGREQNRTVFVPVGINDMGFDREWLVRDGIHSSPPYSSSTRELVFSIASTSRLFPQTERALPSEVTGELTFGDGPWRGHFSGIVRLHEGMEPLHRLFLVGAGMHQLQASNMEHNGAFKTQERDLPSDHLMRFSRTIGALGDQATWERFIGLDIVIIGCGRTGSLVASTFARSSIRQLTLIDPDVVEEHNLGEMDMVTDADIGDYKVEAVVRKFRSSLSSPMQHFTTIASSVTDASAIKACRKAHILCCCVDTDAARLTTAIIATLYHKVLVDIGTGIFLNSQDIPRLKERKERGLTDESSLSSKPTHRTMGADIRLVLPADGCLLCRGHLTDYARAVVEVCHSRPTRQNLLWNEQRAGSLRSLNNLAAALGIQMLQDLVSERLQKSTWIHIAFDDTGQLSVNYPGFQSPALQSCPLCPRTGLGDALL